MVLKKKRPWKLCNCNFQKCSQVLEINVLNETNIIQYSKYSKMLYSIFSAPLPNPSNQLLLFKENIEAQTM